MFGVERSYLGRTINIATPIVIGQIGQAVVALADNIMVGHLGAVSLGAVAFAGMIILNVMVFGTGIAIGLTPLVGENYVQIGHRKCSNLLQNSLLLNGVISVLLVVLLLAIQPLFLYLGQPQEILDVGADYYFIVTLSIVPFMLFMSFKQFMDGLGNTRLTMIITIVSNLVNIVLNYALIYGKLGAPAMGVYGAGLATFISRLIMPIIYFIAIYRSVIYGKYLKFFAISNFSFSTNKALFFLGLPISSQMIVEILALSATIVMFGWLGVDAIAAGQINMTIIHILFLLVSGVSAATTILVSHEYGRKNRSSIIKFTKASMLLSGGYMFLSAIVLLFFGEGIVSIFTSDEQVIAVGANMLKFVAFMEILDGLQVAVLGALRGIKDVKKPMRYAFISYVFVGITMGYIGGFVLDLGEGGVWLGFTSGLLVAFLLFIRRFRKIIRVIRFDR